MTEQQQIVAHTDDHDTIECPHCDHESSAPTTPPMGTLERPARPLTTRLASANDCQDNDGN